MVDNLAGSLLGFAIAFCSYRLGLWSGRADATLEYLRIKLYGRCKHATPTCDNCRKKWVLQ